MSAYASHLRASQPFQFVDDGRVRCLSYVLLLLRGWMKDRKGQGRLSPGMLRSAVDVTSCSHPLPPTQHQLSLSHTHTNPYMPYIYITHHQQHVPPPPKTTQKKTAGGLRRGVERCGPLRRRDKRALRPLDEGRAEPLSGVDPAADDPGADPRLVSFSLYVCVCVCVSVCLCVWIRASIDWLLHLLGRTPVLAHISFHPYSELYLTPQRGGPRRPRRLLPRHVRGLLHARPQARHHLLQGVWIHGWME
jgi:hypothetical protein